ncbi:glycosyltransferase family 2 protein [Synechococcus sp. J7-Johnson]|uniref:glycosyltransferase n=1 Tax=Synechococcus sp. J7-Johnson TaxID=2823737 RepID=UPI0020CF594C|nr:glycosyltransferase family 2 protein [Synechococcus sp. J7-Johnson]MCP9841188.1 glycosyltransferase family 2 protein [Synechococcus sp. J7-Johnson]
MDTPERLSIVLPTYNERQNVARILEELLPLKQRFDLEVLFVDDDSADGTADLVKQLAHGQAGVRLIRRVGRAGLASAIKEGILDATGDVIVVMDCDGQHEPAAVEAAVEALLSSGSDLVVGSRFHAEAAIHGLSEKRTRNSTWANTIARFSLPGYRRLTDYMSGFFALRPEAALRYVRRVDVNGFKFLYELLSISRGSLRVSEIPLHFQARVAGDSKLDLAIVWDLGVSILHTLLLRSIPRRAISFALVGLSGVAVQMLVVQALMGTAGLVFKQALPIAVVVAASSNYLINNALTFRFQRQQGTALLKGLLKFLLVASLPVLANVGVASTFYNLVSRNTFWAQLAGILVVFVWNYAASSRFVWNTP